MFEAAELGRTVSKEDYKTQIAELRAQLLAVQQQLRDSNVPVIVIIAGVDAAGKGEVVNRLNEWLDTRGIETHAYWDSTDEEKERPPYWRYWRNLPARGIIGIHFGAWYSHAIDMRFDEIWDEGRLDAELSRIKDLEQMLTADDALILKFWFHLPRDVQKKRLAALEKDPRSRWHAAPQLSRKPKHYKQFLAVSERVIRETDSGHAPWFMIEATDRRYRDLTVGRTVLEAIRARLQHVEQHGGNGLSSHAPSLPQTPTAQVTVLDHVKLAGLDERGDYKERMQTYQGRLNELVWETYTQKRSCVMVFEGWDAAGKGGAIRRITNSIDARLYRVFPVAAPTDEERAHHYLWRFWRHLPRAGRLTIYDRSWYGRVLVERVEGFAAEHHWRRAYHEINEFEQQLAEHGIVLLKFWLHISKEEQLRRFRERERVAYKQHKITDEDWRNRERWGDYKAAVNEMVIRTSTEYAPWYLIPGEDKRVGRLEVIKTVCERLEAALKSS
ncbi:MAG: polyphosphate:AMP phosphotransferase [Chromatiales bacterium]|jgi:polyphosphate:AMP phosphotransferase|nr:polyphosphate:AMP phosphotransferase [Chromatiales bacterium]MDX9768393.1 polyphosphate:AMP phosphotransferase [Ectothiorhodospiraceae bacterium]